MTESSEVLVGYFVRQSSQLRGIFQDVFLPFNGCVDAF